MHQNNMPNDNVPNMSHANGFPSSMPPPNQFVGRASNNGNNMPNTPNTTTSNMGQAQGPSNSMPNTNHFMGNPSFPNSNNTSNNDNIPKMGHNDGHSNSMPHANQFMGGPSSSNGFHRQQQSSHASRNNIPENPTEALLELTQFLTDQIRILRQDLNNMNNRISESENTMRRVNNTLGAVNTSIDTAVNLSGINRVPEPQNRNRRLQSDCQNIYGKKLKEYHFSTAKLCRA